MFSGWEANGLYCTIYCNLLGCAICLLRQSSVTLAFYTNWTPCFQLLTVFSYPCPFYSRKLSSAEAIYDIGNRELLAIMEALEEWRHWLEGVIHPFQVLTDDKNLKCIKGAKRLNPRQACWTLFQFTVTYPPGSKSVLLRITNSWNQIPCVCQPTWPINPILILNNLRKPAGIASNSMLYFFGRNLDITFFKKLWFWRC
ncbi:Ty3/Gypsy family RNase HI domain-containing protein [Plesiomonas sp.]|uniref:Ty3/Gypsy family RNase HI domain-containing protein n=1 Tax=Plesiomonas sp. TaxID=2486279 RepID=UPI003F3C9B2A